jgi:hypothetical protein
MLLIDAASGRVASVDPSHLRVPALTLGPWRSPDDARAWLRRLKVKEADLLRALTNELERLKLLRQGGGATADAVMTAAARALATSQIKAARRIDPSKIVVRFNDRAPEADLAHEAWVRRSGRLDFRSKKSADALIAQLAKNRQTAAEFERALTHESSRPWRASSLFTGGRWDVASLLQSGVLALRPQSPDLSSWRIAWPLKRTTGAVTPVSLPPARPAPALPPPAPKGPASSLPDPSDVSSPQAQSLLQAAQDGTPFCEECARLAAGGPTLPPAPPATSDQAQTLIAAAQRGAPFCAECARLAAEQAAQADQEADT